MAFYGRERHGGERMVRGVRASMPRRGWHGDVRGRRQAGEGGTSAGLGRARGGVARSAAVGRLGDVLNRRGDGGAVHARRLFDSEMAGRAPATAGNGVGQERWGCHGESQGDTGQLLDMVVEDFGAGLAMWPSDGHVHGLGM